MKKSFVFIGVAILIFVSLHCSKKGNAIFQPRIGTYKFTTYTADTFRFRVVLNEEILTDSLLSPQGSVTKNIHFFESAGQLKIIDTRNNEVIIDSVIKLEIGSTTISLVQFASGERPYIPSPPNESPPAPGNYKIRFQYVSPTNPVVPFFDSVRCILNNTTGINGAYIAIDSMILHQYELTPFYEVSSSVKFRVRLKKDDDGTQITYMIQNIPGIVQGFNTVLVRGTGTMTTNGPYRFEYVRVY